MQEGHDHDGERACRFCRWAHSRADRSVHHPPAHASAGPGSLGGRLRDRAARRGRGPDLPATAHARLRRVDDLPVPPDGRTHARGRPRNDHRRPRLRRGRRRGDASQSVPLRPLFRRPRTVHGPCPRLQRLHHGAVHAVLRSSGPHGPYSPHRRRRGRGRDRAGRRRRLPGHPPAGGAAEALLLAGVRSRYGRRRRPTASTCSSIPRPAA